MNSLKCLIAGTWLLVFSSGVSWAAKPGSGATPDTTPPADLTEISVAPGMRGLLVSFTATGDDGNSGVAKKYETKLIEGACSSDDLPEPWQAWPGAPIARTVSGSTEPRRDGIDFSPLVPGQDYCAQIRVSDDVGLFTTTSPIQGQTLPGDWALTALSTADAGFAYLFDAVLERPDASGEQALLIAMHPRTSTNVVQGVNLIRVAPVTQSGAPTPPPLSTFDAYDAVSSPIVHEQADSDDCALSEGDCVVQIKLGSSPLLGSNITSIPGNNFPAIAVAEGVIGIVVIGSNGAGTRALLLERREAGWTSEVLPHVPMGASTRVAFAYIDGNPAFTWTKSVSADEVRLMLSVRTPQNTWVDTDLVTHTRVSRKVGPAGFQRSALHQDALGRVKVFVAPFPNGGGAGVNGVYLVRKPIGDLEYTVCTDETWLHYYTPLLDGGAWGWATGLDEDGRLLTASEPLHPTDVVISIGHEGATGFLSSPHCGTALNGSQNNVRDTTLSWTNVLSDVPSSWSNAWVPDGPKGVVDSACGVQIGLDILVGNGGGVEQQVVRVGASGPTTLTQRIDHAKGMARGDTLSLMPNGDLVSIYTNSGDADAELVVARGPACPVPD